MTGRFRSQCREVKRWARTVVEGAEAGCLVVLRERLWRRARGGGGDDPFGGGRGAGGLHDRGCHRQRGSAPLRLPPWPSSRIEAAAEAARPVPFPFILTARAHNLLYSDPSLEETVQDCRPLRRPAPTCSSPQACPILPPCAPCARRSRSPSTSWPGFRGRSFSTAELAAAGVRRISVASSFYRAAMTALLAAAREVRDTGQFAFVERCVTVRELHTLMGIRRTGSTDSRSDSGDDARPRRASSRAHPFNKPPPQPLRYSGRLHEGGCFRRVAGAQVRVVPLDLLAGPVGDVAEVVRFGRPPGGPGV